jgi:hypothetical protein
LDHAQDHLHFYHGIVHGHPPGHSLLVEFVFQIGFGMGLVADRAEPLV